MDFKGYEKIEYIQNSGVKYIDLDIQATRDTFEAFNITEYPKDVSTAIKLGMFIRPKEPIVVSVNKLDDTQKKQIERVFWRLVVPKQYDPDTGEIVISRCVEKSTDAIGYYWHKEHQFKYINLDTGKVCIKKPKNFLTMQIIKDYIEQFGKDKVPFTVMECIK